MKRSTTRPTRAIRWAASNRSSTTRSSRSPPASTLAISTPATSWARRSSWFACEGQQGGERTIVFSGDLGRPGSPILRDYTAVTSADYVLVETTYGGREHEPEQEAIDVLAETVPACCAVAGRAAGALVRNRAYPGHRLRAGSADRCRARFPCYLCISIHPWAPRRPTSTGATPSTTTRMRRAVQQQGGTPLDYPRQIITNDVETVPADCPRTAAVHDRCVQRHAHRRARRRPSTRPDRRPERNNPVRRLPGRRNVGRQPAGGATTAKVNGQVVAVRCQIKSVSGFSAHADEPGLLEWLRNFGANGVRRVFLVHGEPDAQAAHRAKNRSARSADARACNGTSSHAGLIGFSTTSCPLHVRAI